MSTITIDEIRRDLTGYLQRVKAGETFLVIDSDQPLAEIKLVTQKGSGLRSSGLCAGEFRVPDDFDMPGIC
jgi:antitoxin (DNA-binding transcriptional repressor) of toxin-antitoxin stability system